MRYQGSKAKFAKEMLRYILPYRRDGQWWVEPFCGSCSVTQHVIGNRIASDNNRYLIAMWQALQNGWMPPTDVSEEEYKAIKNDKDAYPPELVAFVGVAVSFGGKWFGGYARSHDRVNHAGQGYRSLLKQTSSLLGVLYSHNSYDQLEIPPHSLIYCDPPYANTAKYHKGFDHTSFWSWVREKCREGHLVFVSEYDAPSDFESIWDYTRPSMMDKKSYNKAYTERLFVWKKVSR